MDRKIRRPESSLPPARQLPRALLWSRGTRARRIASRAWLVLFLLCAGCSGIAVAGDKPAAAIQVALRPGPGEQPAGQWWFILLLLGLCAGLAALILIPRAVERRGAQWIDLSAFSLLPHRLLGELALLRVEAGEGPPGRRVLPIKNATTRIGRAAENDIVFAEEKAVSRHHVVIEYQGGSFRISEVTSIQEGRIIRPTYGTFVNGVSISGNQVYLQAGDEIRLGKRLTLRFQPLVKTQVKRKEDETRTVDHRTG